MPYSTRRVSLNLQSLGVQLPQSRGSRGSPPNPSQTSAGTSEHPPAKRVKRSHTLDTSALPITTLATRPKARKSISSPSEKPTTSAHFTPPPSPGSLSQLGKRVDTQDLKDEVVVAVIRQLEATGNKPHQIKDLAQILAGVLDSVAGSQNPVAMISSRLTSYLKRPWTALAPSPLTKEQVTVHPRRVYYFLTTMPRQEIPEYSKNPHSPRHTITPSVSSGTESERSSEFFERDRDELSPESEFEFHPANDLAAHGISEIHFADEDFDGNMPDVETDPTPVSMQSNHPPLESDEREFSQTAGAMRQRKESEQAGSRRTSRPSSSGPDEVEEDNDRQHPFPQIVEEPEEMDEDQSGHLYIHNQDAASMLFGLKHQHAFHDFTSSPMMQPALSGMTSNMPRKHVQMQSAPDSMFAWSDLKSPENVELAELDDLLCGY